MATMLQVKLGVLILAVVGVVAVAGAGAGNSSLCEYHVLIETGDERGAGTDAYVLVGIFDQYNRGWRHSFSGGTRNFYRDASLQWVSAPGECMEPCRLTLSISSGSAGSAWYPEKVNIGVYDEGVTDIKYRRYNQLFVLQDWVYEGYPMERRAGWCQNNPSAS
jgi:hypothetical protein